MVYYRLVTTIVYVIEGQKNTLLILEVKISSVFLLHCLVEALLFIHNGINRFDTGITEALFFQSGDTSNGSTSRGADIVL